MEPGLPNPATYDYGSEVKRIFNELVAIGGPPATPAHYNKLQEVARAKAIAPKDSFGRTINQPGYGSSVPPDWGKDPSNQPGTQAQAAQVIADLILGVGPISQIAPAATRPTPYSTQGDSGSAAAPIGGQAMAGASTIGPQASSGLIEGLTGALGGFATGGLGGGILGGITGLLGGNGGSNKQPNCPEGFTWNGEQCVRAGAIGTIQQILPGGQTGTMVDQYGAAVLGSFGRPALVPRQVGTVTRKDGSTAPILRCPPGAVLGLDNLCYDKRAIRNSDRKHPRPPRPIMTSQDAKTLRQIHTIQNRVKRAWQAAGKPGQTHSRRK